MRRQAPQELLGGGRLSRTPIVPARNDASGATRARRDRKKWLPDRDSNPDNQDQNLASYQLDDPATPGLYKRTPVGMQRKNGGRPDR